ncbi:hypothetical protein H6F88_31815 [Oculatella sp. FACHB-28]|uniref:hypothetical protein n=1 Tax=Oculatella sp. FACHB-28 TaxID=2692845 RepID=UPI001686C5F5|nr:hypothetical protein [Oculatella sp. FACHB-28]MBD2060531.1 hypothetical protein [Oculatella sp. FACHB-28]
MKTITPRQASKIVSLLEQAIAQREVAEGATYINQQQAEVIKYQVLDIYSDIYK